MKTAVVILNWNGKSLMQQFLPSLIEYTPPYEAEIIVADNGSTDDSVSFLKEHYPEIKIIALEENLGFAEGYNRALALLDHQYVVLLNSDVEVTPGWLTTAIDYMDRNPEVVALQPKILSYRDKTSFEYAGACGGYMDMYGYPYCRGRVLNVTEKDRHQYDTVADVLWATGACLFVNLDVYKESGGLDAYFFAHQEEIDLCWRLVSRGMKIVCLPSSVVYHVGGATLAMESPRKTFLNFRNNLLTIYKNIPEKYFRKIFIIRFFLDYTAAIQFLLKGYPANAYAVLKARRDFGRQKKNYASIRKENMALSLPGLPVMMNRKSLIVAFYLKKKRTFNEFDN
ncbi:MAG: glycosyltransferase family 2 protein [Dysgonamonadaceae bacterium]|jgi:GT2 family glycosyltransferase|nr:glycosyltransferase family 2 protein [Dysgonamonadaceae bacterium]